MKPQSLQDAIKAAAAAKRNKVEKGGWKEPEVKAHKMTAEEYETMKRGGRPSVPAAVAPVSSSLPSSGASATNGQHQRSLDAMRHEIERERLEFRREKQEILDAMRACQVDANEASTACSALQRTVHQLQRQVEALETDNQSLRDKVRTLGSSSSHHSNGSSHRNSNHSSLSKLGAAADFDWDRLEGRVERMESEHRKLKERIVSGGGGGSGGSDPEIDRLQLKMDRLEAETRALRDKLARVDRLEEETRNLREKLSALSLTTTASPAPSSSSSTTTTTLTSPRNVPVPPKSPSPSKNSYAPASPITPSKKAVAVATATPSPTKSPRRVKSAGSIKGAGDSSSSLNFGGSSSSSSSSSSPLYTLFSAEKIAKYQARDDALKAYLANPNAPIGMYPRKVLSVEMVQGRSLVHFRSKVYVPACLRERAMEWHLETYHDRAKERLSDHCTWPHQERDMFDYVRNHS